MTWDQYWAWYWKHLEMTLIVVVPILIGSVAWAILSRWYNHKERKDYYIKLHTR